MLFSKLLFILKGSGGSGLWILELEGLGSEFGLLLVSFNEDDMDIDIKIEKEGSETELEIEKLEEGEAFGIPERVIFDEGV